jgi:hypothetical protein
MLMYDYFEFTDNSLRAFDDSRCDRVVPRRRVCLWLNLRPDRSLFAW